MIQAPRISIGVPMYRSARFLDNIIANIEGIQGEDLEYVLADHHQLDDAAAQLDQRFAGDSRVRVITTRDEINWMENFNFLLHQMTGDYFLWLPHDDRLPDDGLARLADQLDARPDAMGIMGPLERYDTEGNLLTRTDTHRMRPVPADASWTMQHCLEIFANLRYNAGPKGLWRRAAIIENDLFMRPTRDAVEPERVWMFGIALHGRILFDEQYIYRKQISCESVSSLWDTGLRHELSYICVGYDYLRAARGRALAMGLFPLLAAIGLTVRPARRLRRLIIRRRRWDQS